MNRLKKQRISKGYSQKYIADILGITRPAYANIENGKRNLNSEMLRILADALDVSADYLLYRSNTETIQCHITIKDQHKRIIPLLEGLSDSDLQRVEDFVAGLKAARAGAAAAPDPDRPMQK